LRERAAEEGFRSLREAQEWIEQNFQVRYSLDGVRSLFQRLNIIRKTPRPMAVKASPEMREAWKKGAWRPL